MKAENYYYFVAQYSDGEEYQQGADDVSIQLPDKNAFYDIWYNPVKPLEDLVRFALLPADGHSLPVFAVNLKAMCFEAAGAAFYPYNTIKQYPNGRQASLRLTDPRLIYFRINEATATINLENGSHSGGTLKVVGYILGFQANDQDGENHQFIMRI